MSDIVSSVGADGRVILERRATDSVAECDMVQRNNHPAICAYVLVTGGIHSDW